MLPIGWQSARGLRQVKLRWLGKSLWLGVCVLQLVACSALQQKAPLSATSVASQSSVEAASSSSDLNSSASSSAPAEIWPRLSANFVLEAGQGSRFQAKSAWFTKHPKHLAYLTRNSEPYIYYVVESLEQAGLPGEIALIPMIESAYNPKARNKSGPLGLWQFTRGTGRVLKLPDTAYFNGRLDAIASTDAAIAYLKTLNGLFEGDWLLTIAAYNAGELTIKRAMNRNRKAGKKTDFWHLDLPSYTEDYIPHLLALRDVIKQSEQYGATLLPVANQPVLARVKVPKPVSLAWAATAAETTEARLKQLNTGLLSKTTPPGEFWLAVPVSKKDTLIAALPTAPDIKPVAAALAVSPVPSQAVYRVKSGDSLWTIARKHGTSVKKLVSLNGLNPKKPLKPGQKLHLPK
jgi:membrane-bound lytic murein transglycosylase D